MSAAPSKPPLPSTVFDWNQLVARPTPAGEIRPVVDAPTATFANFECHVTTLRPREPSHAPHQHADEEIVIVKEGTLEITINGQPHRAPAGSVVFIASNDHHGLRNGGDTTAIYHVLRIVAPAP
jgi:quercetin dioxygenase-like cupin family protein